jgi:putative (di)nucleoside polyphosphate hydrolase
MTAALRYRRGVGIMLLDAEKRVFVGRRIDTPGAWQMPQGGIDAGERPRRAALRELKEEIGTDKAAIIGETKSWLRYDIPVALHATAWGGGYRGQEQKWFAMRFTGDDSEINLANPAGTHQQEFAAWRWEPMQNVAGLVVPFKRAVYERVVKEFAPLAK